MKFESKETIAKMGSKILWYIQSTHMTSMQYSDGLYAKSCKVADVYDNYTSNDISVEGFDPSIWHSIREYWATHHQRT